MNYTTQMDAARKGIITKEMEIVSQKEQVDVNELRELIANGQVVIPANKNHKSLSAEGVGKNLRTKINVNLGISRDCKDIEKELEKVRVAIDMKAEAIMDLSNYGKTREFREKVVEMSPAMIGSVPMYDAVGYLEKELKDITEEEFLNVIRQHAIDGVDFITIHAGLTRSVCQKIKNHERLTHIVSRGGSLLFAWMELNNKENPIYTNFDKILDICEEYDVTLSLGDACRPGCIKDSTDGVQIQELVVLEKRLCHGAPFYVLGPLVTDIAPGYDHITSAIGGALACAKGVDFLCYVTPAEHLRLPNLDDMKEGIIAAKIAAHAGDIAKNVKGAREWDNKMSKARADLDWCEMFRLAIDPEKAKRYRDESTPTHEDSCTMCGKMCSMRTVKKILNNEELNLI